VYRPEDITPVDLLGYLRKSQDRFFRGGSYDPLEAATMIAGEALRRGAAEVQIRSDSEWLIIEADHDWLGELEVDAFSKITSFPEGGQNSMLDEVLLMAFSRGVVTSSASGVRIIKGKSAASLGDFRRDHGRAVAFMFALSEDIETGA
jgi:transcriptional antiterminator Rof (Rho-off)